MRKALEHLHAARAELAESEHNKGGWRVRALEHVDRANRGDGKGNGGRKIGFGPRLTAQKKQGDCPSGAE
jgi:hypothetical protein